MSNRFKRLLVKLLRIRPRVFREEEKEEIRKQMIESNRKKDQNILHCPQKLLAGLDVEKVILPNACAWLVTKPENPKDKIILYIHGGGFVGGSSKERMPFISALCNRFGYNVFSVDYRLAPEFMYPAGLNDCFDAYRHLLEHFAAKDILLLGESAGGTLAIAMSLMARDRRLELPRAVYANSTVTQMQQYTDSYDRFSMKEDFIIVRGILENTCGIYMKEDELCEPYVSLQFADLKNLPPVCLSASACESLSDDATALANKLRDAGNECRLLLYPKLCHAFIVSPQMRAVVKKAYPDLQTYLDHYLKGEEP